MKKKVSEKSGGRDSLFIETVSFPHTLTGTDRVCGELWPFFCTKLQLREMTWHKSIVRLNDKI